MNRDLGLRRCSIALLFCFVWLVWNEFSASFSKENSSGDLYAESPYWRTRPGGLAAVGYHFPELNQSRDGYQDLEFFVRVDLDPGNSLADYSIPESVQGNDRYIGYYWAQQFAFAKTRNGVDGYFGLQTVGSVSSASETPALRNDPSKNRFVKRTRIAIFSIWNSLDGKPVGKNSYAAPYGHEGKGWSCKIEYPWKQGVKYGLHLSKTGETDIQRDASWWQGAVVDYSTKKKTPIGKILVPNSWGNLSNHASMFTEYYSMTVNQKIGDTDEKAKKQSPRVCQYMPKAIISIFPPVANQGMVKVSSMTPRNYGKCRGSSVFTTTKGEEVPSGKKLVAILRNRTGHLEKKK